MLHWEGNCIRRDTRTAANPQSKEDHLPQLIQKPDITNTQILKLAPTPFEIYAAPLKDLLLQKSSTNQKAVASTLHLFPEDGSQVPDADL